MKDNKFTTKPGPPVYLQHGIQDSGDAWVVNDENSPAFILARAGYDVWLGNFRGNKYSKRNVNISVSTPQFWNFGWEEMGLYDIPANTEYILKKTGYQKLTYIAHSMGCTAAFFALSQNPDYYAQRWNLFVSLAPALTMANITSPMLNFLAQPVNFYLIQQTMQLLGIYELFPANWDNSGILTPLYTLYIAPK